MKRILLLFSAMLIALSMWGQLSKTVNVTTSGELKNLISVSEANAITTLVLSGNVDARDFAFLRDKLKIVADIDMTSTTIKAYSGSEGTNSGINTSYPANEIPQYAFHNPLLKTYKSSLTSFKFPANTTSIGYLAFYYSWNLSGSVYLPASLTNITDYSFYGCASITAFTTPNSNRRYSTLNGVILSKAQDTLFVCPPAKAGAYSIPTTVKHIGPSAFENTYALTSISLPASLESIGSYAFCYSAGISGSLSLPASLKKMEDGAFYGCWNLTGTVFIPATLTEMGEYCFLESNNIQSFNVNSLNPSYSSFNDAFYSKNRDSLFICPGGKTGAFEIPASVKLIGSHAFYKCNKIGTTISIPATVDYIGYYAFYGCTLISNFSVNSTNQYFKSENGLLFSKSGDRLISCPASKSGAYQIPATVKSVDPAAMAFCNKLTGTLSIPAATEAIGDFAFYGCDLIESFAVEAGNTRYSSRDGIVFNNAGDSLLISPLSKSGIYNIPYGVKHIGVSAFDGCTKLTEINLPSTVESIGNYAFEYCSGLTAFEIPQNTLNIGAGAFYSCSNLQELSIANTLPPIVDYYTFDLINKSVCELLVPSGTAANYRIAPYWGEFSTIQEKVFINGLKANINNRITIARGNNNIIIKGLIASDIIEIYNIQGNLVLKSKANEETMIFNLKGASVYLIRVDGHVSKVVL
ncbi:MAG: leucine-rich repeat domain-containing protein [Paludibacteraceae bacterium]|nr:leucine-rich repeat domain-containing protein [Paludibacteraceae bacterium]